MSPSIVIIGNGGNGSWAIRGYQMGKALGARAAVSYGCDSITHEIDEADIVIIVKRGSPFWANYAHKRGKFVVWDTVDCWRQPEQNRDFASAKRHVLHLYTILRPHFTIFATACMRRDFVDIPGTVVYHHAREAQQINPIRPKVEVVGYEGSERYVEPIRPMIESVCAEFGARFVVNPESLAYTDVMLAFRAGEWGGAVPVRWKSNVKLANAQATGTPIICNREHGYIETDAGCVYYAETEREFRMCMEWLMPQETRREVHQRMLKNSSTVELHSVAAGYLAAIVEAYAQR